LAFSIAFIQMGTSFFPVQHHLTKGVFFHIRHFLQYRFHNEGEYAHGQQADKKLERLHIGPFGMYLLNKYRFPQEIFVVRYLINRSGLFRTSLMIKIGRSGVFQDQIDVLIRYAFYLFLQRGGGVI